MSPTLAPIDPGDPAAVVEGIASEGVVVVRGLVPPELSTEVRRAVEPSWAGGRTGRLTNAWVSLPAVRRLAAHPPLLDLLHAVLGGRAVPFQTLDFREGTQQRAHADTIHFDTVPSGAMCGAWVALEDVAADQGPLVVYPGSHRLPVLTPASLGVGPDRFDLGAYEDRLDESLRAAGIDPVDVTVAAGDVVIWAANLAHGGAAIRRAGSTRWSQVTHYVRAGSVVVTPMRSDPAAGWYDVRDPVIDISTGIVARPDRAAIVHGRGRRSRVVPGRSSTPIRTRPGSACRSAVRRLRWEVHRAVGSHRVPRPA